MTISEELTGIGAYQSQERERDRTDQRERLDMEQTRLNASLQPRSSGGRGGRVPALSGGIGSTASRSVMGRPDMVSGGGIDPVGSADEDYDEEKIALLEGAVERANNLVAGQRTAREMEAKGDKKGAEKARKTNMQETNRSVMEMIGNGDDQGAAILYNSSAYARAAGKQVYGFRKEQRKDGRWMGIPLDRNREDIKTAIPISLSPVTTETTKAGKAIRDRYMGDGTTGAAIGGTGALALAEHWRKKGKSTNETIGVVEQKIAELKGVNPEATPQDISDFLQANADSLAPKSTKAKAKKRLVDERRVKPGSAFIDIGGKKMGIGPQEKQGEAAGTAAPQEASLRQMLESKGKTPEEVEGYIDRAYERGDFGPPQASQANQPSATGASKPAGAGGASGTVRSKQGLLDSIGDWISYGIGEAKEKHELFLLLRKNKRYITGPEQKRLVGILTENAAAGDEESAETLKKVLKKGKGSLSKKEQGILAYEQRKAELIRERQRKSTAGAFARESSGIDSLSNQAAAKSQQEQDARIGTASAAYRAGATEPVSSRPKVRGLNYAELEEG
jgi:hypothetical protein